MFGTLRQLGFRAASFVILILVLVIPPCGVSWSGAATPTSKTRAKSASAQSNRKPAPLQNTSTKAPADVPKLYLSWHAPYGRPGASDTLFTACNDTSVVDTLFMTFELPRPAPAIIEATGTVYFNPKAGDTLREYWAFKSGMANEGNFRVEFAPFWKAVPRSPWSVQGDFSASYDFVSGRARLSVFNTVSELKATGIDPGVRYDFAMMKIRQRRNDLSGCRQPVCAEWGYAKFTFATGRELEVYGSEGCTARWNARAGTRFERSNPPTARPWRPKAGG